MFQPNLRHLEMFQLLMKTRSLTETARLMRISQPAVSQALRELEGQLGLTLFLRSGGRIRPSEEALTIRSDIERVLGQVSALSARAEDLRNTRAGHVSIAAIPVVATSIIPAAIAALRTERPMSRLTLRSLATGDVVQMVKEERVDLGFVVAPIDEMLAGAEPLFETILACVLPKEHRLAEKEAITAADLDGETVIALSTEIPPGLLLQEALNRRRVEDFVAIGTNSAAAAVELVMEGVGIAIVDPMPLVRNADTSGLVIRPFEPGVSITVLALFSRNRPLPKIALQFVNHTRHTFVDTARRLKALGIPAEAL
ncbi:LysR substrate-binding domain-containing protein [Acuticoccus sp. M5D2P5]|uniref:LysR family transcriptional regulator n=1 Tax=Acuticoccus kalidii TaxID=2910977 RepID=UPI001F3187D2|nr:LysR substrate-binding domain-containing protein [Acuticoccus kalidii]MCF3934782.1 LysR substrate-binding domain-containing protein [Acuticoccus kalidii]